MTGVVVSDCNNKTIAVQIERRFMNALYKKIVKVKKKYYAHDENNSAKIGDIVRIQEAKKMSKTKNWILVDNAEEKQ